MGGSEVSSHTAHYKPHSHVPRNVRVTHAEEQQGINDKIAVMLTKVVGSMPTAYSFIVLAVVGLLAILGILTPLVALLVAWTSQTLIQLVLLPVIMVGQNVLNRHQELQSDEEYKKTLKIFQDVESVMLQNAEQLEILEEQNKLLTTQYLELTKQTEMLTALLTPPSTTVRRRVRKQEVSQE
jgi:anaerobic C4-dicarboxylate transporter